MDEKEYKIEIDPRILELLVFSLYTNIYYVSQSMSVSYNKEIFCMILKNSISITILNV